MLRSQLAKEERGRSMENHTVPLELIREILLRLPVRSVLRFKCVCKQWLCLISDPQFCISHYDLAASPSHRLLFRSNVVYVESIDIDAPLNNFSGAVHLPLPPPSPPHHGYYDYYADYHDKHEILGSCRGLILLYYDRTSDLILWNPSISVHKRLPNFENNITCHFLYGFGHDTATDDYLLILIELYESEYDECQGEIQIFSFKTAWDSSFKEIHVSYIDPGYKFRAGTLFNEALHWLVFSQDKNTIVIIAFDLIQRSLLEIPLFDYLNREKYLVYNLRVMGGCLSVCCSVRGSETTEIWVMKEYKEQSSWTKIVVIPIYGFSPICITKDGGIFGSNNRGKLEKLDDKGELLDHLIHGQGQGLNCANLQSAMYRESLLSLPGVIGENK